MKNNCFYNLHNIGTILTIWHAKQTIDTLFLVRILWNINITSKQNTNHNKIEEAELHRYIL